MPINNLADIQELRDWFDRVLAADFRKLEQTRHATVKTLIVATLIFSALLGCILVGGLKLEEATASIKIEEVSSGIYTTGLCTQEMAKSECDLLTSTAQTAKLYSQARDLRPTIPIPIGIHEAIFAAIIIFGWMFIAFIGSVLDNYRLGWRSPIVRQLIDFIDRDKMMTYVGQAETQDVRQALLHSGMADRDRQELIFIDLHDSIAIKREHIRISWSDVHATIPTDSFLSVVDSFFANLYERSGLKRLLKVNFASLIIKCLRAIGYAIRALIARRFDLDDFSREIIGNDAGRKIIFKGIFCQVLLPETDELGQMLVLPSSSKRQASNLKIPKNLKQKVKIADDEFDRLFTIYSSDKTTPAQILSPVVRRFAIDYYRASKYPVYLSINERMLYIGIVTPCQLLEPQLGKKTIGFAPVRDYYQAVKFMLDLATALTLVGERKYI